MAFISACDRLLRNGMFQTVIYMSSLCWVAYSLYGAEYQLQITFHTDSMMSTMNPNALFGADCR
ncbi:hypothetical protein KIN20_008679 [Parelaphostrongylus tenuis]|uniref:Uncharacterized protein n=1 Tax=Parelaphostrongylus tenuis TaxID=148309 RepID=A0AAD5MN31_PARTN|nr:hypothetical protein KIN20_008679 [Parelaphostrongylus tenuis]